MATMFVKQQVSICPDSPKSGQLQQLLKAWTVQRNRLQSHWQRYKTKSGGHHVSYRAWSRYGAYLEAQQETDKN